MKQKNNVVVFATLKKNSFRQPKFWLWREGIDSNQPANSLNLDHKSPEDNVGSGMGYIVCSLETGVEASRALLVTIHSGGGMCR